MTKTDVREGENLEDALRRFKRSVSKSGTLREARKREHYEKPSVKRKLKSEEARKRDRKKSSPTIRIRLLGFLYIIDERGGVFV